MNATLSPAFAARLQRAMKWYVPSRFGIFYHYGLFTGGGCSVRESAGLPGEPLKYKTGAEFDAATPPAQVVARNLVAAAKNAGARYTILTVLHSGESQCVLYPTNVPAYLYKTQKDYIGAFLDEAHAAGLKALLYFPMGPGEWDQGPVGPMLAEGYRSLEEYMSGAFPALLREMHDRYGQRIDGFWLDGKVEDTVRASIPPLVRSLWPDAIQVTNGDGETTCPELDIATSEEYEDTPSPPYNRWSAYRRNGRWGSTPPRRDLNEDIPHVGKGFYWWWGGEGSTDEHYTSDRFFLLRQMCCAIGQRGIWNFAPGIGPQIDGTVPDEVQPSLDSIRDFLAWGSEAVFGTQGAEATIMTPGYFNHHNSIGFCSITRPFGCENKFYVLVTQTPLKGFALFETAGYIPKKISDMRTGVELPFKMFGSGPYLEGVDWSDVDRYGVKVLVFEF